MKALISDKVLKSLPNENHDIWNSRCRYRVLPPFATVLIAAFFWSFPTAQAPSALVATTVQVDSPALVFSPANWSGDSGRRGNQFRQTWNSGAYFRFSWSSTAAEPRATILFDTSMFTEAMSTKPMLAYEVDGVWTSDVEIAPEVPITRLKGAGRHLLTVYVQATQQDYRWGTRTTGAANVVRLTGIRIGANDHIEAADRAPRWILEIGDSITEGIAANDRKADALSGYAYLIGQALQARGYEFGISACGWSGWLRPGDRLGDVPPYYSVTGSVNGRGGVYDDDASRWNKIDAKTSLLDAHGHLSGYGGVGQEPSLITINYGTNEGLNLGRWSESDLRASVTQSLAALRGAAPQAVIFVIVPFGRYVESELRAGIDGYRLSRTDNNFFVVDLGLSVANALVPNGFWGGLHPNARGHATIAARIIPDIVSRMPAQ